MAGHLQKSDRQVSMVLYGKYGLFFGYLQEDIEEGEKKS